MADDLPLWISTDQADRLRAELEGAGFANVAYESFDCGRVLGIIALSGSLDRRHVVRIDTPTELSGVVWQFKKWREQLDA